MTNEAGSSTTAGTGSPGSRPVRDPAGLTAPAAVGLALLTLGWLGAMIWSARAQLRGAEFAEIAITVAANAVPVLAQGALVAGLGAGLLASNLLVRRGRTNASTRFLAATGAGLLVGTVAALTVHFTYYSGTANMVLAGTTVAAATIGGAVAGFLLTPAAGAVAAGTLTAYLMVLALSLFTDNLRSLFGAGETQESQVAAAQWVSRTSSLAAGLAAGLVVFAYLRWSLRRAQAHSKTLGLPPYLLAGAGTGLLLLIAEAITQFGGRSILDVAGSLSEADSIVQRVIGGSRWDHAIIVLFVGALAAVIAYGRTLEPKRHPEDEAQESAAVSR
ncbi:hypothetical protein [Melissospora conviva]|uniref:hypothetical protein n=1 Tax=Melissospora conviva TaxID=3388432 RepID=UPI003C288464